MSSRAWNWHASQGRSLTLANNVVNLMTKAGQLTEGEARSPATSVRGADNTILRIGEPIADFGLAEIFLGSVSNYIVHCFILFCCLL